MAVVDSEAIEHPCKRRNVFGHVFPEPRVVLWSATVIELDAVTPDNDFAAEVRVGGREGKVLERIRVPDPTVVSEGEGSRVVFLGYIVGRQSRKVGFNERETKVKSITESTRR